MSEQQEQKVRDLTQRTPHVYWLSPPRNWLHARINTRVEQMFADGLLEEVLQLSQASRPLSHTARQALGYKEVLDWIEAGKPLRSSQRIDESNVPRELIELIQTRTRQFAKRQHTWFRNLDECVPIEIEGDESADVLAERIAAKAFPT